MFIFPGHELPFKKYFYENTPHQGTIHGHTSAGIIYGLPILDF